ncbi:MAG TPA: alpha/beta hydrolase [Actinomycetota bacterium]|jgi:pimeloyl-ACP methyl ester carboxylesterase|nr:alpha/beta hydrolase [Actinomycetota bacterium]
MVQDRTIAGPDGHAIGYGDYGDPTGSPIFFLPGLGDSRLTRFPDDEVTASLRVRLITIDAPGVGLSDYLPLRSQLQGAERVAFVADALGIDRFALLGWSAGGPRALAVAYRFPERVRALGIASGFGPLERADTRSLASKQIRQGAAMLSKLPWMAKLFVASVPRAYRKDPRRAFEKQFGAHASPSDRRLLERPEIAANILAGAQESVRGGAKGMALDMVLLMGRPWGFRPEDVQVPAHLWYGSDDQIVPEAMGRQLAGLLQHSELKVFGGEGHMILFEHWVEILESLRVSSG